MKPHTLIVVHSKEIDDAGEANVGLPTFESTLRQIKAAWHHLQLAGVKNFVFTADHGFLLQDETTGGPPVRHEARPAAAPRARRAPAAEAGHGQRARCRRSATTGSPGTCSSATTRPCSLRASRARPSSTAATARRSASSRCSRSRGSEPRPAGSPSTTSRWSRSRTCSGCIASAFASSCRARPRQRWASRRHASVDLALRVPERDGGSRRHQGRRRAGRAQGTGRFAVPVGEAWTEVFFGLEGPTDERVRSRGPPPGQRREGAQRDARLVVRGERDAAREDDRPLAPPPAAPAAWADTIADEGIRRCSCTSRSTAAVTETEVTGMLGSPRAFRRFSLEFEAHAQGSRSGFGSRRGDGGKRYVREGEK